MSAQGQPPWVSESPLNDLALWGNTFADAGRSAAISGLVGAWIARFPRAMPSLFYTSDLMLEDCREVRQNWVRMGHGPKGEITDGRAWWRNG